MLDDVVELVGKEIAMQRVSDKTECD